MKMIDAEAGYIEATRLCLRMKNEQRAQCKAHNEREKARSNSLRNLLDRLPPTKPLTESGVEEVVRLTIELHVDDEEYRKNALAWLGKLVTGDPLREAQREIDAAIAELTKMGSPVPASLRKAARNLHYAAAVTEQGADLRSRTA